MLVAFTNAALKLISVVIISTKRLVVIISINLIAIDSKNRSHKITCKEFLIKS